jgi:hypothetical protein
MGLLADGIILTQWITFSLTAVGIVVGLFVHRQKLRQDREIALKKDALFGLADAFAEAMVAVGGVPFAPDILAAQQAMARFAGAIGKIHCTASQETLRRVIDVQKVIMRFYQICIAFHVRLKEIQSAVERESESLALNRNALEQFGGDTDDNRINKLRAVLLQQTSNSDKALREAQGNRESLITRIPTELRSVLADVGKAQQEVTLMIRHEFGNKIDQKWYRIAMEEVMNVALSSIEVREGLVNNPDNRSS